MADEGKQPETDENVQPEENTTGYKKVVENGHPYLVDEGTGKKFFDADYVTKLTNENKERRLKLEEFEAAEEKRRLAQLEAKGEYEKITAELKEKLEAQAKELETARAKLQEINEAKEAARQALLQKLPEEKREIYKDATAQILSDVIASLEGGGAPNPDPGKAKTASAQSDEPWAGMYKGM